VYITVCWSSSRFVR